jgi:hypothetical protein
MITTLSQFIKMFENNSTTMDFNSFITELINILDEVAYKYVSYALYLETIGFDEKNFNREEFEIFKESNTAKIKRETETKKRDLAYNYIYRISEYISTDDTFEIVGAPSIGYTSLELAIKVNGIPLNTSSIFAGGYNVQQFHVRVLVKTTIRKRNGSLKEKEDTYLSDLKLEKREYEKNIKNLDKMSREMDRLKKEYNILSDNTLFEEVKVMVNKFKNESGIISELKNSTFLKTPLRKDIYHLDNINSVTKLEKEKVYYYLFDCNKEMFMKSLLEWHPTWKDTDQAHREDTYNRFRVITIEGFDNIIKRFVNKAEVYEKIQDITNSINKVNNFIETTSDNSPIHKLLK